MEQSTVATLTTQIARNFGPPFLPEGFVRVSCENGEFRLWVGDRDMHLDSQGVVAGAGTSVGTGSKWNIGPIPLEEE